MGRHIIKEVTYGGRFSTPDYPHHSRLPWVHPSAVEGYDATIESRNVVHPILESRVPTVTFREPLLRSGTLTLHFADTREAMAAETLHVWGQVLALGLEDPNAADNRWFERHALLESSSMFYVVSGSITRRRSDAGHWVMTVGYQEVKGPNTSRLWGVGA